MNRLFIAALVALMVSASAFAQDAKTDKMDKMDKKTAPMAAKYDKCVVTGETLGEMGKPIDVAYTGKTAMYKGKSVPVCCGGCVAKVKKDPDGYFKKVYGVAKAAPAKTAKPAPKKS